MTRILTVAEAQRLSQVRELLRDIENRLSRSEFDTWHAGRASEAVDAAQEGIFHALNILSAYMLCEVSEAFVQARDDTDRAAARRALVDKERTERAEAEERMT